MNKIINKRTFSKIKMIIIILIPLLTKKKIDKSQLENKIFDYINKNRIDKIISKDFEKELPKINNYINFLKSNINKTQIKYNKKIKPKISIIVSVYNKEKYLPSLILSIQFQLLKEFELIFVDDCSNDKSKEIITFFKKYDNRIKLIENKENFGALYTKCKGAMNAKGEYIIFIDSDDIVLREGLLKVYSYIKNNQLDIVQFHTIFNANGNIFVNRRFYNYKNIIYQPILSYIFYYNNTEGSEQNTALWDKLVKKNIVKKAIRYIGKNYLEKKIIIEDDVILLFSIFKYSNSYQYLDEIGYYYFLYNSDSITNTQNDPKKLDKIIYSLFTNILFLFEKTDNSYLDKYYCIFKINQFYSKYNILFKNKNIQKKTYNYIKTIINKIIESKYISNENKLIISKKKNYH